MPEAQPSFIALPRDQAAYALMSDIEYERLWKKANTMYYDFMMVGYDALPYPITPKPAGLQPVWIFIIGGVFPSLIGAAFAASSELCSPIYASLGILATGAVITYSYTLYSKTDSVHQQQNAIQNNRSHDDDVIISRGIKEGIARPVGRSGQLIEIVEGKHVSPPVRNGGIFIRC